MKRTVGLVAAIGCAIAVVAGTARPTASASSSVTCNGAVSWTRAASLEGRVATFTGRVKSTKFAASSNGSPTFLNVGHPYPNHNRLSLVIWLENRAAFGRPEVKYRGRRVCVRGRVADYAGSPEIVLRRPSQIRVRR